LAEESRLHLGALFLVILIAGLVRLEFLFQPMRYDESVTFVSYASSPWYIAITDYTASNNNVFHSLLDSALRWGALGDQAAGLRRWHPSRPGVVRRGEDARREERRGQFLTRRSGASKSAAAMSTRSYGRRMTPPMIVGWFADCQVSPIWTPSPLHGFTRGSATQGPHKYLFGLRNLRFCPPRVSPDRIPQERILLASGAFGAGTC